MKSISLAAALPRAAVVLIAPGAALAQGVATESQLAPVQIKAGAVRSGLAAQVPSNSASKTAEQLREQNLFNPEDALKYVPNTSIRKRYIGDRNAMIGGRSFGTLQPSRGLAYVDGYLISNFLGRFDGPRWNMVNPEAIARVDVLYGPFSAIYPGNSIGTTVAITEREPRASEASARVVGYEQQFREYGQRNPFGGHQASVVLGDRVSAGPAAGLWFALSVNSQSSTSQPMNYFTVVANAAGDFPSFAGARQGSPTAITGVQYDTDPRGLKRAVFGASGGAIDRTVQDSGKLKLGYAFTPELKASAMLGLWKNQSALSNRPFVLDANGAPVWQGAPVRLTDSAGRVSTRYLVRDVGTPSASGPAPEFELPLSAFAPSEREEFHRHTGFTLKTTRAAGWNASLVGSRYAIVSDLNKQAGVPDNLAASGGAGTWSRRDGTGWNTLEAQAAFTPAEGDVTGGRHALVLGWHRNAYAMNAPTTNASDWRSTETTLAQRFLGRTEVQAVYAQDAWRLTPDWTLTTGVRHEHYRTFEGEQWVRVASCTPSGGAVCEPTPDGSFNKVLNYPQRTLSALSPKASLAWWAASDWVLKLSAGRGVRFPNVEELYTGTVTATTVTLSDPNLRAERSDALEFSVEHDTPKHRLRVSLFSDDVRDGILRQSNTVGATTTTFVSNVDRVRTRGLEWVWQAQDLFLSGLSVDANAAWADAKVVANARDPASVGKQWLRVPRLRAHALLSYRPNHIAGGSWMGSLGVRHSGRAFNDTYNLDVNPNVFGGVSSFTFWDARAAYTLNPHLELALGINNLTDSPGYQAHPYPGRTVFLEVRARH